MKSVDRWWLISQKGNLCVSDESFPVATTWVVIRGLSASRLEEKKLERPALHYTLPSAELVFSLINQSSQLKVNGADSRQWFIWKIISLPKILLPSYPRRKPSIGSNLIQPKVLSVSFIPYRRCDIIIAALTIPVERCIRRYYYHRHR